MPSPVEGDVFSAGTVKPLTFVLGMNITDLTNRTGLLRNLTSGNNYSYNNASITVADNGTGTLRITANLSEAGEYFAQFTANNATLKDYSPVYNFKVVSPL